MKLKTNGVMIARTLEDVLHQKLPHVPLVVCEDEEYEIDVTVVISDIRYEVSYYQLVHDGVDSCAKVLAGMFKRDVTDLHRCKDGGRLA